MNGFDCDLHLHSISSGHAFNTIDEYARYAKSKRYKLVGISDHGPLMEGAPHMGYFEMMCRLPHFNCGVEMLYGCEANILSESGNVDISYNILENLDYTMAGLHKRTPYCGEGIAKNTKAIVNTINKGIIDIITHPVSLNFVTDINDIILAASEQKVLLEANKTILLEAITRKRFDIISDYKKLFRYAEEKNVNIIWGSDAHHVSEMMLSDTNLKYLSEVYEFNFNNVINNNYNVLMDYLKRRQKIRSEICERYA